uniref:RecT protein n=1 Tax=Firmicutes phage HS16 TaxID=3056394 RepID=A0AA49X4P8_9VIRU|nr:MAG: RecT protein [Firmicutes phage HS16]
MTNIQKQGQVSPVNQMKNLLANQGMQNLFADALNENKDRFLASIIDLYNGDTYLQGCNPKEVAMEALKAATLNLPINKSLGYAYIVPYKNKGKLTPQFQIGYKGYIQMAQRSGQYKALNAGILYEGMEVKRDFLRGTFEIIGEPKSDKVLGYFAYFQLLNGYEKAVYMTKDEVTEHAKRYSQAYGSDYSPWKKQFDEMAQKTVIKKLLSKYGVLTTEFQDAVKEEEDREVLRATENNAMLEMTAPDEEEETIEVNPETGEIIEDDVKAPF